MGKRSLSSKTRTESLLRSESNSKHSIIFIFNFFLIFVYNKSNLEFVLFPEDVEMDYFDVSRCAVYLFRAVQASLISFTVIIQ